MSIFTPPADHLKFFSLLAFYCIKYRITLHCATLMSNHFHLLLEDPRGNLSAFMQSLEQSYAAYFNISRGQRGVGCVFKGPFWNERVTSLRYYDEVASYILLNPLRCEPPLASRPEAYA